MTHFSYQISDSFPNVFLRKGLGGSNTTINALQIRKRINQRGKLSVSTVVLRIVLTW